ncbi:MAG: hypothetical protein R3F37_18550 [Candidatus Competibacteraceae bacterium]
MNPTLLKQRIAEEIDLIPTDKLDELYDLLCSFRRRTVTVVESAAASPNIPGDWENISDQIFNHPVIG